MFGEREKSSFKGSPVTASVHACVLSRFSCVQLFVTPWTVALQVPLSMGFFRQEYWSGLPCPPLEGLPNPEIQLASLLSPALAGGFFTTSTTWEALDLNISDAPCLLLGRKVMTNLDSILKSRDITLPTKVHLVKAIIFPVVMYGCQC